MNQVLQPGDVVETWNVEYQRWDRATLHYPSRRGWYVIYPKGSYISCGWAFQIRAISDGIEAVEAIETA